MRVTTENTSELHVEEESERESECEKEERQKKNPAASAAAAASITNSFLALGHKPFGSQRFREIWAEEWSAAGQDPNWIDIMEQTIQRCQSLKVKCQASFSSTNMKLKMDRSRCGTR